MAFASFGAPTLGCAAGRGPYAFVLQGQAYHATGRLHLADGERPQYAQLYMVDSSEASAHRAGRNPRLSHETLEELDAMLAEEVEVPLGGGRTERRARSPYVHAYRKVREDVRAEAARAAARGEEHELATLSIRSVAGSDPRRYNAPVAARVEIAAVFPNDEAGAPPGAREFVVHSVAGGLLRLHKDCEHVDPMVYPLLFPHGEPGWRYNLTYNRVQPRYNNVTLQAWYAYRHAVRGARAQLPDGTVDGGTPAPFALPSGGGHLYQQYVVDGYCKLESNRLDFIKENQNQLRVELYQGLYDFVHGVDGGAGGGRVGRRVVLPSTFGGSPRALQQNYLDAMGIVRQQGKPDLFITMTANPAWPEVKAQLREGSRPRTGRSWWRGCSASSCTRSSRRSSRITSWVGPWGGRT